MAIVMDGKSLAAKTKQQLRVKADELRAKGIIPGLAVVLVGNDPASQIYVRSKKKDCEECNIESFSYELPETTSQQELLDLVHKLNSDPKVSGILVQLPLPKGLDEDAVICAIDPSKDVDCFHPENVGLVCRGQPRFLPCTPGGVMKLLDEYKIDINGKNCVVVGRSDIVGKPQALLLLHRHGTVTICHSRTKNLSEITKQADILVAAVGKAGLITGDMLKEGVVVIDVAMNTCGGQSGGEPSGKRVLCGDVVFDDAEKIASYITPVPGGVGPMTRALLMQNTITAACGGATSL